MFIFPTCDNVAEHFYHSINNPFHPYVPEHDISLSGTSRIQLSRHCPKNYEPP